jgi:hypothetical protein
VKESFDLIKGGDLLIAVPITNVASAALNGVYASMVHVKRLHILIVLAAGTGGEEIDVTLKQATNVYGDSAKALNITKVYYKANANLAAVGSWTEVSTITRYASVATFDTEVVAGAETLQKTFMIVVDEEDLDSNNGFTHVRVELSDPGDGARNGAVLYIAGEMSYQGDDKPGLTSDTTTTTTTTTTEEPTTTTE